MKGSNIRCFFIVFFSLSTPIQKKSTYLTQFDPMNKRWIHVGLGIHLSRKRKHYEIFNKYRRNKVTLSTARLESLVLGAINCPTRKLTHTENELKINMVWFRSGATDWRAYFWWLESKWKLTTPVEYLAVWLADEKWTENDPCKISSILRQYSKIWW